MTSSTPHKTHTRTPHMNPYATNAHTQSLRNERDKQSERGTHTQNRNNSYYITAIICVSVAVHRPSVIVHALCTTATQTHMIKLQFTPYKGLLRMV